MIASLSLNGLRQWTSTVAFLGLFILPAFGTSGQEGHHWIGWTESNLHGSPNPPLPFTVERIYPDIRWRSPIYVIEEPAGENLIVVQQKGNAEDHLLRRVTQNFTAKETITIPFPSEWMIYGMTFDPDYDTNQFVYLFQHGPTGHDPRGNRISRYQYHLNPTPQIDLSSELIIIEWRSAGHDGGDLAFGPDQLLYITTGDGTSDSDGWNSGQTIDDLLGAVLRIDVRGAHPGRPYRVPNDNPFTDTPNARSEIWAYGLRNPWRLGIDQPTGQVWVGNNGQDLWETAHLVRPGENYGWSVYEGSYPFYANRTLGPTPHVKPTIEHPHSAFRSLTGGLVYRGQKWPELDGVYLYGDYATGRIWGAKHDGQTLTWHRELGDTSLALAAFRQTQSGEILLVDHTGNGLYRLVRNQAPRTTTPFPTKLSQTGLFNTPLTLPLQPRPGVIPYTVNAEGWHDGAHINRWMAVPSGEGVTFSGAKSWLFPEGTALVQTLSHPTNAQSDLPLETRIMLRQQDEWTGYSYRWNHEHSDADLVDAEGLVAEISLGPEQTQPWTFPSRSECAVCHSRAANYVLGITGTQLNRPRPSDDSNQLAQLAQNSFFKNPLPNPLPSPLTDPYDTSQPVEARAKAYLHTNCASCHIEAGGGNAQMVLRWDQSIDKMKLVGARPQHATFGLPNAMLISPGRPDDSVLLHRISHRGRGTGQMPPLASHQTDEQATQLFRQWIKTMPPQAQIVREWQMEDLLPGLDSFENGRNYLRGRDLFTQSGCVQCHRFGETGGTVGPDLTGIAKRQTTHELLTSLIDPSQSIAAPYQIPNSVPPLSTMPSGMVDSLTQDQIFDLLYYLVRDGRPRVAAIVTEYRHNSHADVIVGRLLQTDTLDGHGHESPLKLASLFTDQQPLNDTSRSLSVTQGFPIFSTIEGALTLGSEKLSVDAILLIAEHGDYPLSATGNRQYPKRRFWDAIYQVFQNNGRGVPVFIDKHLADRWEDAKDIYDQAKAMNVPIMAGSSLPTTWRRPPADVKRGSNLSQIVAVTYHTTDAYGFHALEFIQALCEQRQGGETGIAHVSSIQGNAVWQAIDTHEVDAELFQAAWSRLTSAHKSTAPDRQRVKDPRLFTLNYQDGLIVHLLELNGAASEWSAAWRYREPDSPVESSLFWTQEGRPAMHFTWLLHGIEKMFLTGKPTWNVERTLLTSGALDALLTSLQKGQSVTTPYLEIDYQSTWRWNEPPPPPPTRPWSGQ